MPKTEKRWTLTAPGEQWMNVRYPDRKTVLLAIRTDLRRVARIEDLPEEYAPSRNAYRKHGRFMLSSVSNTVLELPPTVVGSWLKAVEALGLKPTSRKWESVTLDFEDGIIALDRARTFCGLPLHVAPGISRYRRVAKRLGLPTAYAIKKAAHDTTKWSEAVRYFNHRLPEENMKMVEMLNAPS